MDTTEAFEGLACRGCGTVHDPGAVGGRCPDCRGSLAPTYDLEAVELPRAYLEVRRFESLWRYEELLPFVADAATSMDEGATPLVACPALAEDWGVGRVLIKDEGHNPTGSVVDRGASVALTAARQADVTDVAVASTGNGAQSVAAYAGRAGLESHAFVPARSDFTNKAMINVHGGDMTVVDGRFPDAAAACAEASAEGWRSLNPLDTPYRIEGAKTLLFEIVEQLGWTCPDGIVVPTAHGVTLAGLASGARQYADLGLLSDPPSLYAAQASGCAPIVEAWDAGQDHPADVDVPDTICGDLEVPDPAAGSLALDAIAATGGGAVASDDPDALQAAVDVAQVAGLEVGVSGGAAVAGGRALAGDAFGATDTVVIVNPTQGSKNDDVLRSHLMGQGV